MLINVSTKRKRSFVVIFDFCHIELKTLGKIINQNSH